MGENCSKFYYNYFLLSRRKVEKMCGVIVLKV